MYDCSTMSSATGEAADAFAAVHGFYGDQDSHGGKR